MQRTVKRLSDSASGLARAFRALLMTRFRLQFRGWKLRLVAEPSSAKLAARNLPPRRPDSLPPMPGRQVIAAHVDLRALLNRAPAARRLWPSLALLERVLCSGGFDGIHRVDACVLRHAAQSLDMLGDQHFSPGIVVLRRRIELVLRRKHRDEPSHWARTPSPAGARHRAQSTDTVTDYIDLDGMLFRSGAPSSAHRVTRRSRSGRPALA